MVDVQSESSDGAYNYPIIKTLATELPTQQPCGAPQRTPIPVSLGPPWCQQEGARVVWSQRRESGERRTTEESGSASLPSDNDVTRVATRHGEQRIATVGSHGGRRYLSCGDPPGAGGGGPKSPGGSDAGSGRWSGEQRTARESGSTSLSSSPGKRGEPVKGGEPEPSSVSPESSGWIAVWLGPASARAVRGLKVTSRMAAPRGLER
ncbi:hypothetical protein NDU88_005565 [Pleurodeles waltl]|uniref:Uncharacterized protein n=1 Tax=Pleurodeles waltl TaxID=8319 RepID=A0AAV7NWZ6_PLEWA|nr:hypothetical protein NDU88_005565 [Pleurodeles waltl]